MSNSDFEQIGSARLSRTGKALQLNLFRVRLFIDLDRLKGLMQNGEFDAPIWIFRRDKYKLKERQLKR